MANLLSDIQETFGRDAPLNLPRRSPDEWHFVVANDAELLRLCQWAADREFLLCTIVATDERLLEDHAFKLYYVLSSPQSEMVIAERKLDDQHNPTHFASIRSLFPAALPLEDEIHQMFGLSTKDRRPAGGASTPRVSYAAELYPLRRNRSRERLSRMIGEQDSVVPDGDEEPLPVGQLIMPVGWIHAGVIEAGHFPMRIAGEVIEDAPIRLGAKHRGIEKLFEARSLADGWQLAERVSGDSSVAHALAYCQAVESLAGCDPPVAALYWRGLLLELERLYNHVGDVAAMVQDMGFDLFSGQLAVERERAMQLNGRVTGSRLLRGMTRPGGVILPAGRDVHAALHDVQHTIPIIVDRFTALSKTVLEMPACRERAMDIGRLRWRQARDWGAAGLVARAAGFQSHREAGLPVPEAQGDELERLEQALFLADYRAKDFRLRHPQGVYARESALQDEICHTVAPNDSPLQDISRRVPIFRRHMRGDVQARLALRVAEVETSGCLIQILTNRLRERAQDALVELSIDEQMRATPNYELGLGYVEGWRGNVFYVVMKGPDHSIFRCKVRAPSLFNWPVMSLTLTEPTGPDAENARLADFPLINKSFNLSYAGNDL